MPKQPKSSDELLTYMFGTEGRTWKEQFRDDQNEALREDAETVPMSRLVSGVVSGRRYDRIQSRRVPELIEDKLRFGGRAEFRGGRLRSDLYTPVTWMYARLVAMSPIGKGRYKRGHMYTVAGKPVGTVTKQIANEQASRVGITNLVPYAAVLENPGWFRTYLRVLRAARRKFGKDYDLRLSYIHAKEIKAKDKYFHPHLEVAPLGSLAKTGFVYKKRRSKKQRRKRR